ncbi:hypothetical protein JTE90_020325 [Oedothorax gibbosus]|uniref:WAP domain-containing protein n=1 Tax=Oedothorax gibbosus TaxID=931172 RepID=A0AAV6VNA1_9ARAC|nr:hypothetical protein JTE90_020325 [Oedothorax gibbosus]
MKICVFLLLVTLCAAYASSGYCPQGENIQCFRAQNKCCGDGDCSAGQICCSENCGTKCRTPIHKGKAGIKYDSKPGDQCKIDKF